MKNYVKKLFKFSRGPFNYYVRITFTLRSYYLPPCSYMFTCLQRRTPSPSLPTPHPCERSHFWTVSRFSLNCSHQKGFRIAMSFREASNVKFVDRNVCWQRRNFCKLLTLCLNFNQWHIKKHQFNALNLAPELITMSQLRLKIYKQPEDIPVSPI